MSRRRKAPTGSVPGSIHAAIQKRMAVAAFGAVTAAFAIFVGANARADLPSDAEFTSKLVGSWVVPVRELNATVRSGQIQFKSDGTFTSLGLYNLGNVQMEVNAEGKWKVENGVLIEEVTKSSHPHSVAVGLITRDTLLEVTDKEYRFRSENGPEQSRIRQEVEETSPAPSASVPPSPSS